MTKSAVLPFKLASEFLHDPLAMAFAVYWVIAGPARRKVWIGALYSVLTTAAIWLLFARLLNAFLPQGSLF